MRLVRRRATLEFENKLCPHSYKESQNSVSPGVLPCLITRQELHLKIIFSQLNVIGGSKFKTMLDNITS